MKMRSFSALAIVAASGSAMAGGDTLEFEDLTAGMTYSNGDSFVTQGITVDVIDFTFSSGTTFSGGQTFVSNPNGAGAGNGMGMGNVNLDFQFPFPLTTVGFAFDDAGGNVNLWVNNSLLNFEDFSLMDGMMVGGVNVSVSETMPGSNRGVVTLTGNITQFAAGGQEFAMDDVRYVPVPGTPALLGLGGLALARRRR